MDINVEDLTVLILTVSPAKEFTPWKTACYFFRLTDKEVVGWEKNGEKCPAGKLHSYLWLRKGSFKSSNPNFISHLTSCLILVFLCSPTQNSSCCPLVLLQLPVTPTHVPLCQLVSQLPHSVTLPLSTKMFSSDSAWFTPCPALSCITHALLNLCHKLLRHLGPFSLAPASPPMPFFPFH